MVWRQKYVILASVVLMVALALVYTQIASKRYQATALVEVDLTTGNRTSSDTTATNQALAKDYATLLTSPGFLRTIARRGEGGALTLDKLESSISATSAENSALVTLKATAGSPAAAQTIAGYVINGFLLHLQANAASTTTKLQTELQKQIAALTAKISALASRNADPTVAAQVNTLTASRQALIEQSATLVANGLAHGTSASLSAPPSASSDPISPKRWLDLLAGLILGAVLGVGLGWALELWRPAIHSARDLREVTDLPVLASIPLNARDEHALTDAYRVLYTNLRFLLRANDSRVVTVVSLHSKVGKSSTVEGLARVVDKDRKVLVVDGDIRTGTLSKRLGYGDHAGLVEVLTEVSSLDEAVVKLDDAVSLLPARPPREDIPGLFSWRRTLAVMSLLRERFALVLIDSPPLAGLADGLILSSQSDSVLLVVRAGMTKPADVAAAVSSLQHNKTPIAGLVVFEELSTDSYYPFVGEGSKGDPIREAL
jgi:Mrp family chromosome partitioning ATPase